MPDDGRSHFEKLRDWFSGLHGMQRSVLYIGAGLFALCFLFVPWANWRHGGFTYQPIFLPPDGVFREGQLNWHRLLTHVSVVVVVTVVAFFVSGERKK